MLCGGLVYIHRKYLIVGAVGLLIRVGTFKGIKGVAVRVDRQNERILSEIYIKPQGIVDLGD